jgi:hypothetical protein
LNVRRSLLYSVNSAKQARDLLNVNPPQAAQT